MNMKNLLQQAQEMQQRMQKELSEMEVSASVGGDMVTAKMNGHKTLLKIDISESVITNPDDREMLEDLIVAAVNQAGSRVDERIQSAFGSHAASIPKIF